MEEMLTKQIAKEYQIRARKLPLNGMQDAGEKRVLRIELQRRCGLTELEAINIINGFHVRDYIAKYERRAREDERSKSD